MTTSPPTDVPTLRTAPPLKPKPKPPGRIAVLDSIRGIAVLIVAFYHSYGALSAPSRAQFAWLYKTPLAILLNGEGAVTLFFVLSGFVLALAYTRSGIQAPRYGQFCVKRIFRIYVPFAAAIGIAAVLYAAVPHQWLPAAWNYGIWEKWQPMNASMLFGHLRMSGLSRDLRLDGPSWSLVQEMRISLIFPLLMLICRNHWRGPLAAAACLWLTAGASRGNFTQFPSDTDSLYATFLVTAYLIPCFFAGIFLAQHRVAVRNYLMKRNRYQTAGLWLAVLGVFILCRHFENRLPLIAASVLLLGLSVSSKTATKILQNAILRWFGRVSYSLYLLHVPVMYALIQTLHEKLPQAIILALAFITAIGAAEVMRRLVEIPSIRLGKMLARRVPV